MTASAVLVGLTAIVAFGGTAILRIAAGGHGTAPGLPMPTALPLPVIAPSSVPGVPGGPAATAHPPRRAPRRGGSHMAAAPDPHPSSAAPAPSPAPSLAAARHGPAIAVTYRVADQWDGGFEGQVQVTNNTAQPIGGWQIVVAVPQDQITSFWNASGYVSNGILLLHPAAHAQPLAPGGTLNVYFVAQGTEITPEACAFDGITCG